MRALLDINVLVALIDFDHVFHERAHSWWSSAQNNGWASCPLTENGVVRIMSNPNYSTPDLYSVGDIATWLSDFASNADHEFWHDDLSLTNKELFDLDLILGPRQITDLYLLAMAAARDGVFVTFDQGISVLPVKDALPGHLLVI